MSSATGAAVSHPTRPLRIKDRDLELVEPFLKGHSFRTIAANETAEGRKISREGVRAAVSRALRHMSAQRLETLPQAAAERSAQLDRLLEKAWELIANAGADSDAMSRGIREARRCIELRAKIDGVLDQPTADTGEQISVAEVQGEALVQVLILVLGSSELGLDVEKQDIARALAGRHLRALTS